MEYQRLTIRDNIGCFKYDLKDFKHKIGEFGDYDAFFAYSMAVKRLGELNITYNEKTGKWRKDTEYMSDEFCQAVLAKWLSDMERS